MRARIHPKLTSGRVKIIRLSISSRVGPASVLIQLRMYLSPYAQVAQALPCFFLNRSGYPNTLRASDSPGRRPYAVHNRQEFAFNLPDRLPLREATSHHVSKGLWRGAFDLWLRPPCAAPRSRPEPSGTGFRQAFADRARERGSRRISSFARRP